MDNASSNTAMMPILECELRRHGISFHYTKNHIWYIILHHLQEFGMTNVCRCFPHIVNHACQAVLKAMTDMQLIAETAHDFDPESTVAEHDLIALV
jgi:hypothetical protein